MNQEKPRCPTDQENALYILRHRWGCMKTLTRADYEWLASKFEGEPAMTAVEMCLRVAGLWEEYKAADFPKWDDFRAWLIKINA